MTRKRKRPTPEELEAGADAILRQSDHDTLIRMAENVEMIRASFEQLKLPSNDPDYLRKLQVTEATRAAIANKLTQIDIVPDGNKSYLGIGSFQHHEALELARKLAEHFETKIRAYE